MTTEVKIFSIEPKDDQKIEPADEYRLNKVMATVGNIQRGLKETTGYKITLSDRFTAIEMKHYITAETQPAPEEKKRVVNLVPNENAATPFSPVMDQESTLDGIPLEAEKEWW